VDEVHHTAPNTRSGAAIPPRQHHIPLKQNTFVRLFFIRAFVVNLPLA
jgi:hypothetical protein